VSFKFVLEDQSTYTDEAHGGPLVPSTLSEIAWAAQYALDGCGAQSPPQTVCGCYGGEGSTVRVGIADPAQGEIAVIIRDSYPSEPGAGGWHTDENGRPAIFVSRQYSTSLTKGAFNLAELVTHEIGEATGDAGANRFADRDNGIEEALELCDRIEADVWTTPNGVDVSNWLLPSAFIPGSAGPWDYKGTLKGQYDKTEQGYAILREDGANLPDQARAPHPSQAERLAWPGSRLARRGHRFAA
jgi:hypothetical protein